MHVVWLAPPTKVMKASNEVVNVSFIDSPLLGVGRLGFIGYEGPFSEVGGPCL